MLRYTAAVTLLAILFYLFLATRVAAARRTFGVALPATTGHPEFERIHRIHINTLEWMPIFLPSLWLCAFYCSDRIAAALGVAWIAGRALYAAGYRKAVEKRLAGFGIQAICCVLLFLGAAIGLIGQW
ncbi:MAG TPA: MAPEG family protein [Roseomonas sp.]|jgi:glutathione S-transferase